MQDSFPPPEIKVFHQSQKYIFLEKKAANLLWLLYNLSIDSSAKAELHGFVNRVMGINAYVPIEEIGPHDARDYESPSTDTYRRNRIAQLYFDRVSDPPF